jgi:hypothetical protein
MRLTVADLDACIVAMKWQAERAAENAAEEITLHRGVSAHLGREAKMSYAWAALTAARPAWQRRCRDSERCGMN